MESSRALAPPAIKSGQRRQRQGARHISEDRDFDIKTLKRDDPFAMRHLTVAK